MMSIKYTFFLFQQLMNYMLVKFVNHHIDRNHILTQLGQGGIAAVYHARDTRLGCKMVGLVFSILRVISFMGWIQVVVVSVAQHPELEKRFAKGSS